MAGNYKKKNTTRRRSNILGQLLLAAVFFIAGYISASLYDLTNLSAWVGTHLLAKTTSKMLIPTQEQANVAPKPKFEFYTLLANEQVAGSAPPTSSVQPTALAENSQPALPLVKNTIAPAPAPLASPAAVVAANTVALQAPLPEKKLAPIVNNRDAYLIQVASFKSMSEAEHMKASLTMKGFDVNIAMVNQQRVNWYRVIIGPFASREQAQQMLVTFARREHITGMIRKMDA